MTQQQNRRAFMQQTALIGVGAFVSGRGFSLAEDNKSPNAKVNIACIGVGGKGSSDTDHAGQVGNIVALCDIDDTRLNAKAAQFPQAKKYNDFRKMLAEMDQQIDAVTVSTPDHTHAPASLMAMKLGKHVYCQKPLTYSVYEARQMRETAAKMKVVTQMGNQGTADDGVRRAVEIIQSGAIGPVREVHVWTDRPGRYWPQAPDLTSRPTDTPACPAHVHWDLFLGPAPERPYHPAYHPFKWRGWWDFGTGALGDMACHVANLAFLALNLGYPTSVVAESGEINPETCPAWATVTYEFPARGELPPVKLVWYEENRKGKRNLPPEKLFQGQTPPGNGLIMVGDKGTLYSPDPYGAKFLLLPEKDFAGFQGPPQSLPRNGKGDLGMKEEWVAAMKGGPAPLSNFAHAGLFTETILLGNVAMRVGQKIEWDGANLQVRNSPAAAQYIRREPRSGWDL